MRSLVKFGIIWTISILIIVIGLTVGILWPMIYSGIMNYFLSLTESSTNYKMWKRTPVPMYFKFHMFNWTNPDKFTGDNIEKPHFVEMGPYVFREVDEKVNQTWNENGTITFQRKRVWFFEPSMSSGSLDDRVTNLDPISASVAHAMKYKNVILKRIANKIMEILGQNLTTTKTVGELLFDGYNNTMLKIAKKLNLTTIPFKKFGWFVERNESASFDGTFNMDTGVANLKYLGMIREWNYRNKTDYYQGQCGQVMGTNGDLWPPLKNNLTVDIFVSDICTNLRLVYDNQTVVQGIISNKYIGDERMLDDGTKVPSRSCYCRKGVDVCVPTGMLNVSSCKFDAPAFVSSPHFYLADSSYLKAVTGLKPDRAKHEMSLTLEPETGVPMEIAAKLQLNMMIENDSIMYMFKNISTTFIPMLWFSQEVLLTSDYASLVKLLLVLRTLGVVTFFGIASIGCLLFFIGIFAWVRRKWRGEENQVLLSRREKDDMPNGN